MYVYDKVLFTYCLVHVQESWIFKVQRITLAAVLYVSSWPWLLSVLLLSNEQLDSLLCWTSLQLSEEACGLHICGGLWWPTHYVELNVCVCSLRPPRSTNDTRKWSITSCFPVWATAEGKLLSCSIFFSEFMKSCVCGFVWFVLRNSCCWKRRWLLSSRLQMFSLTQRQQSGHCMIIEAIQSVYLYCIYMSSDVLWHLDIEWHWLFKQQSCKQGNM